MGQLDPQARASQSSQVLFSELAERKAMDPALQKVDTAIAYSLHNLPVQFCGVIQCTSSMQHSLLYGPAHSPQCMYMYDIYKQLQNIIHSTCSQEYSLDVALSVSHTFACTCIYACCDLYMYMHYRPSHVIIVNRLKGSHTRIGTFIIWSQYSSPQLWREKCINESLCR